MVSADGKLLDASIGVQPKWFSIGAWTIVLYFIIQYVADEPYDKVCFALISILAVQNLIKLYAFYGLDDGCRTDFDGYTDCDDSYVQIIERVASKAEETQQVLFLMAAELYSTSIFTIVIFVVGAILKHKIREWVWELKWRPAKVNQIINSYGKHLEANPVTTDILDIDLLPYKKLHILTAIYTAIERSDNDDQVEALKIAAISLANYQVDLAKIGEHSTFGQVNKDKESFLYKSKWASVESEVKNILVEIEAAVSKRK